MISNNSLKSRGHSALALAPRAFFSLSPILALLAVAPAFGAVDRVVTRNYDVAPGGTVQVSTEGGKIQVEAADSPDANVGVRIEAREHIRAGSDAEADELLKGLDLQIEQHAGDVSATAHYDRHGWGFQMGSNPVRVDFVVKVPKRCSVNLTTSGGDISISNLNGQVKAHTSGGDISIGRILGDVSATTSGGEVNLGGAQGAVHLVSSGGHITTGPLAGRAEIKTSGGSIRVESIQGRLSALTSGGNVRAAFSGPMDGDSELSTSGGSVDATLGAATACNLDASTSGGSVSVKHLTVAIERGAPGRNRLEGSVGGGGPRLRLHSSGGDIEIQSGS